MEPKTNFPISINKTLKTKRLTLRYPCVADASVIFNAVNSPQFPEQLPLKAMRSESGIEAWLNRLQAGWAAGRVYSWMLVERGSGQVVGQATLARVEDEHKWALAFWIHPEHWGNGYATEAAKRLLAFGFEELGAETIWAGTGLWNTGSMRVLEKIGMQFCGDNPEGYYSRGKPVATREYEMSRSRWQEIAGQ